MNPAKRTDNNSNPKTMPNQRRVGLSKHQNVAPLHSQLERKSPIESDDETTNATKSGVEEQVPRDDDPPLSSEDDVCLPSWASISETKTTARNHTKKQAGTKRRNRDPEGSDSSDNEGHGESSRGRMAKTTFGGDASGGRETISEERKAPSRQERRISPKRQTRGRPGKETTSKTATVNTNKDETDLTDPESTTNGKRKLPTGDRLGSHLEPLARPSFLSSQPRPTILRTFKSKKVNGINIMADQKKSGVARKKGTQLAVKLDSDRSSPVRPYQMYHSPPLPAEKRRKKQRDERQETPDSPQATQAPVFKTYKAFSPIRGSAADDGPIIITSSPVQARSDSLAWLTTSSSTPSSSGHVCPMCNEDVDPDLLENFKRKHPRMTIDQEQRFCQLHKRNSAKTAWDKNGYPDIRWSALDARIAKRYDFLRNILEGGKSYYGDVFSKKVRDGQYKTLLKSEENLTPGYYGIRGLRAMSENIVAEFSTLLRKRAVKDRLVSARGHTAYVQSVLVPELTVQLIMEDMDVDEEEARSIMKESVWVGELLNEEVADVIMSDDESGSE